MIINTNVAAIRANRALNTVQNSLQSSMEKLSSGFRINHASDDAAGLGISNKLQADVAALNQAARNAQQANSLLQIAEGATGTIAKILTRMKQIASNAASDNVDDKGRAQIKAEWDQIVSEINATANTTKFQGTTLINGGFGNAVDTVTTATHSTALAAGTGVYAASISGAAAGTYSLTVATDGNLTMTHGSVTQTLTVAAGKQTVSFSKFGITLDLSADFVETAAGSGADSTDIVVEAGSSGGSFLVRSSGDYSGNDLVSITNVDLRTSALNLDGVTLTGNGTAAEWQAAITAVDGAIDKANTAYGAIGAAQNRISYALTNAQTEADNFTAAVSTIRDVDMASEMTAFSSSQILSQAGIAMLAQANQSAQGILQLLRG